MEDTKAFIPLLQEGIEILKQGRSAFCHVLEGKSGCTVQVHNVEDHAASSFSYKKAKIVPEMKYSKRLSKNLWVSVWRDDLTTHKVDAVVNAANEQLSHGAGLAQALSQAGGPRIQKMSNDIIYSTGRVPTGEAVVTEAGNLPCKMIIHAVGPCVSPVATMKELNHASDLLKNTIWSILQKADFENLQSVAIPAISSGLYNFPLSECANIIAHMVKLFSEKRNRGARDLEVRLVNHDDPSVQEMHRACIQILGTSDLMPMQNQGNAPTQAPLPSLDLGKVTLHLKTGALENEKTNVIVNTISSTLDLSAGLVSNALLKKAGQKIQDEIRRQRHGSEGDVIETASYNLDCKAVYHTVCAQRNTTSVEVIFSVVKKCLMKLSSKSASSISFPALGTGNLGLQKDECAQIMTNAVVEFSKSYKGWKMEVFFVIFPKDTETLKAFEKEMTSINKKLQTFQVPSSSGKSSGYHGSLGIGTTPCIELFAPSPEALQEAKRWSRDMLHFRSGSLEIYNNHVMHLGQEDHEKLMLLQTTFNVIITEFFKEGKGGIIINGEHGVGVSVAALEVEAMLCQAQENFARSEEKNMQDDLKNMYMAEDSGQRQQIEKTPNIKYEKTPVDLSDRKGKELVKDFRKCGLQIEKVEKIENCALKQLFEFNKKRISGEHRRLYQCVKAQYCDLICRVGFQREYAPPKEQKSGAGIYFASEVDKAKALWPGSEEEYIYFIGAQVLTGKDIANGSSNLIVPPPIGKDPLVRYDSVNNGKGIHVIFNGQQAYPELLITCSKSRKLSSPV